MVNDAISQAEAMIAAFARAGGEQFDVTLKTLVGEKRDFRRNVSGKKLRSNLPVLMEIAERESLSIIVRPHSKTASYIQLDDIDGDDASRLIPYSCCVLESSTGNYQAFIAVTGLDRAGKEIVRNALIENTAADKGASGAARLAGSYNFKYQRQLSDGRYPRVRLVSPGTGKVFSVPELVAAGLIKTQLSGVPRPSIPTPTKPPRRHIFPSYERTALYVRRKEDGTIDRSAVDLLFAVTCLDWQISVEQTSKLLHAHSPKAAERYDNYVERTVAKAHVIVEKRRVRERRRGRRPSTSSRALLIVEK